MEQVFIPSPGAWAVALVCGRAARHVPRVVHVRQDGGYRDDLSVLRLRLSGILCGGMIPD
jgi:hypothetical protein